MRNVIFVFPVMWKLTLFHTDLIIEMCVFVILLHDSNLYFNSSHCLLLVTTIAIIYSYYIVTH